MCYGCNNQRHIAKFCKQRKLCQICKKQHPTALHDPHWKAQNKPDKEKETEDSSKSNQKANPQGNQINSSHATVCDITEAGDAPVNMSIVPIWLHHKDNPDKKVAFYALLDKASGGTFIKQEILKKLGVKESYTKLQLTTMHGTKKWTLKLLKV